MSYGSFPPEFDVDLYLRSNPDLAGFPAEEARLHFERYGENEGRIASGISSRESFLALVPRDRLALEIGPFNSPCLRGKNVRYFDVMDSAALRDRAKLHGLGQSGVPETIHYISPTADLTSVGDKFSSVLSSHAIEHSPDLVKHLQDVASLLAPDGVYYVVCPDNRYCFDQTLENSTIADALDAHFTQRRVHSLTSVIEHRALATHNDPVRHWAGDSPPRAVSAATIQAAIDEWRASNGGYIDVHAWQFAPQSFRQIVNLLFELGLSPLKVERVYPTVRNSIEFYAILRPGA